MESPGGVCGALRDHSKGLPGRAKSSIGAPHSHPLRVLAIGDSFTFGVGAEQDETWPAVLEERLDGPAPGTAEVLNAGVQGWGLAEYWIWLDKYGAAYQPDWVILGVHRSDWMTAFRGLVSLDEAGVLTAHPRAESGVGRLKQITARIPFYETLVEWSVLANYAKTALSQRMRGGSTSNLEGSDQRSEAERFDDGWAVNQALLRASEARANDVGARVALIFIPTYEYVMGDDASDSAEPRFQAALSAYAAEHGTPFVDMTPRFQAAIAAGAAVEDLYFLGDGHSTPEGYRLIAQAAHELVTPQ